MRPARPEDPWSPGRRRHDAAGPGQIPAAEWREIALRAWGHSRRDNLSIVAAGVAFFALLALFPALAAAVSIYGLLADPGDVREQINAAAALLPSRALDVLDARLKSLAAGGKTGLGLTAAFGLMLAVWSATKGARALMTALNIVYDEREDRGLVKRNAVAVLLTLGGILFGLLALGVVAAVPVVLGLIGLKEDLRALVSVVNWSALAVLVVALLAAVYRYGPSRTPPRWRWVSYGAVSASVLWLLGSALFSIYVSNFGSYDATYGSVGAIVILLLWLYLTAYIVLLGAALNAETERQTVQRTAADG